MWIVQRFLVIVAIGIVLIFGMFNAGELVQVRFWFGEGNTFASSPLPIVMTLFFLIGVLFYYLFSIPREWRLRAEIRRMRRLSQTRDRELTDLRNIALETDIEPEIQFAEKEVSK
jgi:uncharacterized integral membrane protein